VSRVLVVEDDVVLAQTLAEVLTRAGHEAAYFTSGIEALRALKQSAWDVVVTDLVLRESDGFAVLEAARRHAPPLQVIMATGHGSKDVAVRALKEGAAYYLEKPIDLEELLAKVAKAAAGRDRDLETQELRRQVDRAYGLGGMVGRSPKMLAVFDTLWQVAPSQATVLIRGESGTGKELVARALHALSPRRGSPFVALNCGGMGEGIIESERFGHVKGAYTGALADRKGRFEFADGGTLFLDEVGEMPQATQVKLLRVLEERHVTRLGANTPRPVDVRLVAATNADLEEKVRRGEFRNDLYYRIKVVEIQLPALRERRDDVRLLVEHFIAQFATHHGRDIRGIEPEALHRLMAHDWPGNVRALRNCIETMVVTGRGPLLTAADLPPSVQPLPAPAADPIACLVGRTLEEVERGLIGATLSSLDGNRARAARLLGIGERTLYRKIRDFGL